MATIITKNSQTPSAVPSAASLSVGELAVNTADGKLFTEHTGGIVKEIIPSTVSDGGITEVKIANNAVTTNKINNSAVTTDKIANTSVTVAKVSATGTPSSTTFLRGDGSWSASPVSSVLGATGDIGTGGITAGTTYTVYDTGASTWINTPALSVVLGVTTSSYPDWRNVSHEVKVVVTDDGAGTLYTTGYTNFGTTPQFSLIMLNAGTYRFTYITDNTGGTSTAIAGTSNTSQVLVNGTSVYSVSHTGGTDTTRTVDVTVNPFDIVTFQIIRTAGTSTSCIRRVQVQSSNGGTCIRRGIYL